MIRLEISVGEVTDHQFMLVIAGPQLPLGGQGGCRQGLNRPLAIPRPELAGSGGPAALW